MQEGFELGREIDGIDLATAAQQAVEVVHVQDDGRACVLSGAQRMEHREQALVRDVAAPPRVSLAHLPLKRMRKRRIAFKVLKAIRPRISCPYVRPPVIRATFR